MNNVVVCAISHFHISDIAKTNYVTFQEVIENLKFGTKTIDTNLEIYLQVTTCKYDNKYAFNSNDYAILYFSSKTKKYKLGKWNTNTLHNDEEFTKDCICKDLNEFVDKFRYNIITNKLYNYENKLQETGTPCRERVESKGIAIEVKGNCIKVKVGQIGNGTSISYS